MAACTQQPYNFTFQKIDGSPLSNGKIIIRLTTDAKVTCTTTEVYANKVVKGDLDANGSITLSLWPNDRLTPTTVYKVLAYSSSGQLAWEGTFNLTTDVNYLVQEDGVSKFLLETSTTDAILLEVQP